MATNIKKRAIIDASFVLAFLLPDEDSLQEVNQLFNDFKEDRLQLVSSPLLPFEVGNGLNSAVIKKRLNPEDAQKRLGEFLDYQIETLEVDFEETFKLAQDNNLTIYDASYLYLARQQNITIYTLDQQLKNSF